MKATIENSWKQLDESAQILKKRASEIAKLVDRFAIASSDGELNLAVELLGELTPTLNEMQSAQSEAIAKSVAARPAIEMSEAFEKELVETFSETFPNHEVFSSFQSVFVYPIQVSLKSGPLGYEVYVRGQRTVSRRPSKIASLVKESQKEIRTPEQFARVLHKAFRALREGNDWGTASLKSLYEVLAAGPTGAPSYGAERFTLELQVLYVHLVEPIGLSGGKVINRNSFKTADAGGGFLIYLPDGSSIVLGYFSLGEVSDTKP